MSLMYPDNPTRQQKKDVKELAFWSSVPKNNEAHLALGTTLFHSGMCIQDMISFEDVLKEFTSKKCGKLGKLLKESGNHGVQMKNKDSRAPKLTVKHGVKLYMKKVL
ncbi:uncharacterized protein LOC131607321 [Vicia villosa]|uniref:uncharacterized protein LOC131607321 n=1 Tax=Vicia villosa TaxID=3911 RepID=UPI00273B5ABD|nr:uncharacterized protein LOC131607321 [Vicia villosa]